MHNFIYFGMFLPLIGFLGIIAFSSLLNRKMIGICASSIVFLSFISFLVILIEYLGHSQSYSVPLFNWMNLPALSVHFSLLIDPLSIMMALIVTGVGFLIHVYSLGYMENESDFSRFFACMNFFVFSMLLLVLSQDLLGLFFGWEGVGLASYLLIGFWYTRPKATKAATKAFVVNRIGDLGLLLGILMSIAYFGTSDIIQISNLAPYLHKDASTLTIITLLYFIGAVGKSAQLPLYIWLPDAMEGPTPVSALIHAATMVTAGVYLVVRMHVLFLLTPITLGIVGIVGGVTALFAAFCACAQTDLKRVLAYSTISQLGFMFLACGVGSFYAAMFHLMTHAFMKSLLFLSAGIVVHGLGGETCMNKMGGLRKIFRTTHWLFLIGVLAMGGVPPFAAFFSKDMILEQEFLSGDNLLFYIGVLASFLTSFYLLRAYLLTFTGPMRIKAGHEGSRIMLIPVTILAFLSISGGIIGVPSLGPLEGFLSKIGVDLVFSEPEAQFLLTPEVWLALTASLIGFIIAFVMYRFYPLSLGKNLKWLRNALYIEWIYEFCIVLPLNLLARGISRIIEPFLSKIIFESIPSSLNNLSMKMQSMQSGQIRSYVALMTIGAVFLLISLVFVST